MKNLGIMLVVLALVIVGYSYTSHQSIPAIIGKASSFIGIKPSTEQAIVGKWWHIGETDSMEFFSDHTVNIVDTNHKTNYSGTWLVLSDNRIKLTLHALGTQITYVMEQVNFKEPYMKFTSTTPDFKKEVQTYAREAENGDVPGPEDGSTA